MAKEIYKFNEKNFDKNENWNGYVVTSFDWHSWINQSDSIKNLGWVQWVYSSATFIRWRTIVCEGKISANSEAELLTYIKEIKKIFAIDWVPTWEWTKVLEITDENWTVWVANARIKNMPIFRTNLWQWEYRVTFYLSDAVYKSKEFTTVSWNEWILAGKIFPTTFSTAFNKKSISVLLNTDTSLETPLKITITAIWQINWFLKILNKNTGEFYQTNTSCIDWDVIVIDANFRTATKNWVSIIWDKESGSAWLSIDQTTEIIISDSDLIWDFTASIQYKDQLL